MNETLEQFKKNQKRNQEILKKLLDFVHTGEKYGIKVEESLKDKIHNAIKDVSGQKLKVALVGGFSEGKTSIAAAWIDRLNDLISLSEEEKESLIIVAVAANPFDLGVEHWLKHQEEFQKLSHIKALQDATQKKIKENGGKLTIIEETKKSVIQDVVYRQMPPAKQALQDINREMERLNKTLEKRRKDLQNLNSEISQARIHLREFIIRYFSDLIRQVSGTSLETFNDFVIREIGDKGINIETKVQNEFERQTQGIVNEISKIETGFNADMSFF